MQDKIIYEDGTFSYVRMRKSRQKHASERIADYEYKQVRALENCDWHAHEIYTEWIKWEKSTD